MMPLPQLLFFLSFLLLINRSSFFLAPKAHLEVGELCVRSQECKSGCCRKSEERCESHCTRKGSQGSKCHTEMFLGLYQECSCDSNLTCVFPKNQKTFKLIYGSCEKYVNKKINMKTRF